MEKTDADGAGTETRSLSLRALIFMLSAGLVVLVVAASVGLSVYQGRDLGEKAISDALARSAATQDYFERLRYRQLGLITEIMAGDADLRSYLGETLGGSDALFGDGETEIDRESAADALEDRRRAIGFDVAMLLDAEGRLIAHTGRPVGEDEFLDDHPLVARLIEELLPVTGLWQEAGELYQVAMVPLSSGSYLTGFIVAGLRVDAALMDEVRAATGAELVLYSERGVYGSTLTAVETDALMQQLQRQAGAWQGVLDGKSGQAQLSAQLDGRPWVAGIRPFDPGSSMDVVAISLIARDRVLAGYRSLQRAMVLVGGVVILVGLLASLLVARRVAAPLKRFAQAASAASKGDYDQQLRVGGSAEIAQLGQSFDSLLSDLREKQDMEDFLGDLARYLPEPGMEEAQVRSETTEDLRPQHRAVALLGMEFRDVAADDGDARSHVRRLEQKLLVAEQCAARCGGRIEAVMGHRALLGFDGEHAALEALACCGELARSDFELPPMALVSGEADRGSVRTSNLRAGVVIGKPSQQLDLLLEEARPGQLLLAPAVKEALAEALDEPQPAVVAGRVSGRRYYALGPGALASLPGLEGEASATEPVTDELRPGGVFAERFEIVALLGQGGMGRVFKALDRELQDFVALKTLLADIASDSRYLEQLKEEIKLARRITHANVLRTFDFGYHEGIPFISMEYVRGMTLRYLLDQRPQLPYSAGLRIARQLAAGLAAAHGQGVVHRDIKPENLILEAAGNVKLMDFGIAKPVGRLNSEQAQAVFVGTPRYAAPEQMEGRSLDARADVFACGVLMYEMFTGVAPFPESGLTAIYAAKRQEETPAPSEVWRDVPRDLETIIERCLAADPASRFADAEELRRALGRLRA